MIERIRFKNFKVLHDADLQLGPLNILVGPNGSGKSTVFKALELCCKNTNTDVIALRTVGSAKDTSVSLAIYLSGEKKSFGTIWEKNGWYLSNLHGANIGASPIAKDDIQIFALDANKVAAKVQLQPDSRLSKDGSNLAGALDSLRDRSEEAFESLKKDLRLWLPEFDSIQFETPSAGQRSFKLRQAATKEAIASTDLSEGTLLALALLYIAHNPKPPFVVCLEEPDRGLHPRLLRDVRDALYRLAYPAQFGLSSQPVQVIATTHSPYFLDLFKDHPEEIIIAEKQPDATAKFKRLADDADLLEIIGDAPLGEVWYTGILGGVPPGK